MLAASCVRPCEEGMTVETHSPKVEKQRRMLTALLLATTRCRARRRTPRATTHWTHWAGGTD